MEAVSNPIAPDNLIHNDLPTYKLSNSDFRKLLMTPRPPPTQVQNKEDNDNVQHSTTHTSERTDRNRTDPSIQPAQRNKQKFKKIHSKSKRDVHGPEASERVSRYRDRAKERRDGKLDLPVDDGADDKDVEEDDTLTRTADYRAVAPSSAAGASNAERRRMLIQESKYLGGDMEHTHLVKGLDYVLLQKVRLEIQNKELEAEDLLDAELSKPEKVKDITSDESIQFRTRIGASICDTLFNEVLPERNEYFQPGRLAYRIELEDDSVDFEVPATVIRSKSDCLQVDGRGSGTITTNEIVINKLTQILSYLRAGKRQAKKAKLRGRPDERSETGTTKTNKNTNEEIFEGVGTNYAPSSHSNRTTKENASDKKSRSTENRNSKYEEKEFVHPKPYFNAKSDHDNKEGAASNTLAATKEFMNELSQRFGLKDDDKREKASLERLYAKTQVTCYDECYPGFAESYDDDSDDETDFSKMDLGNKKGPVGRWDFETQEEYSDYMSNKEALPKAAFQYGVKMAEGRRTRRIGPKDGKAELDRQLQKIQSIIQKRKQVADTGGPVTKNPRY